MHRIGSPARLFTITRHLLLTASVAVLLAAHIGAGSVAAQTLPVPTDIGNLGGGSAQATAAADGYVVGSSRTSSGETHAFVWSASTNTMFDIGALISGSGGSGATGVNSSGAVVGGSNPPDYSSTNGFYWSQVTGLVSLGPIYPNYNQTPLVISESGVVAGASADGQIFRWTPTDGFTYLGLPPAGSSPVITGINSRGDIVGNSGGRAFFVAGNSTTMTVLTSPDSGEIVIKAINDSGIAVGYYAQAPTFVSDGVFAEARYAFKWDSSTPATAANIVNLGSLSTTGARWSEANGINNSGVIVGYSTVTNPPFVYDAFTYQGSGPMVALQRLPGVDWHAAVGITDGGVVVGLSNSQGTIWENGVPTAFTPSFAPLYNTLFLKGHTLAGTGYDPAYSQHAWVLALPDTPPPPATMFFTDALTGNSSPNLATIPAGKYGYTPSGLQRTQSDGTTDRPMVSTALSSYLTASHFTAEVTATLVNNDLLYFGLGQGDMDPAYFNEPNHGFYFRVHSGWEGNYSIQADVRGPGVFRVNQVGTYALGSTITLRIVRAGDDVTMSVVGGPSVTYSIALDNSSLELDNSNTRVFFGNSSVGSVFSDLKIYETPMVACGPGTFSATGNEPCTPAAPGSYVADAGATEATQCPAGTYSPVEGATSCTQAPAGSFVSDAGASSASACPAGTYSSVEGAVSCTPADPGSYVADTGATEATQCPAGTYSPVAGATSCTPAPAGSYVPVAGASSATACPAGYGSAAGATSCYALDDDGDGVNNDVDAYPNSNVDPTVRVGTCGTGVTNQVMPNGATFNDLLGAAIAGSSNHGGKVVAVVGLAGSWKRSGLITGRQFGAIVSCVARLKVGRHDHDDHDDNCWDRGDDRDDDDRDRGKKDKHNDRDDDNGKGKKSDKKDDKKDDKKKR